jgi:hypothetical protein
MTGGTRNRVFRFGPYIDRSAEPGESAEPQPALY